MTPSPARRGKVPVTLSYAHHGSSNQKRSWGSTFVYLVALAIILFQVSLYIFRDDPALTIGKTPGTTKKTVSGSSFSSANAVYSNRGGSSSSSRDHDTVAAAAYPSELEKEEDDDVSSADGSGTLDPTEEETEEEEELDEDDSDEDEDDGEDDDDEDVDDDQTDDEMDDGDDDAGASSGDNR